MLQGWRGLRPAEIALNVGHSGASVKPQDEILQRISQPWVEPFQYLTLWSRVEHVAGTAGGIAPQSRMVERFAPPPAEAAKPAVDQPLEIGGGE
jgi:hypothetical protein